MVKKPLFWCYTSFRMSELKCPGKEKFLSTFRDSLDNKIDLSDWLVNKKGVLLMLRRSIFQC
jgi:hypothetical protein